MINLMKRGLAAIALVLCTAPAAAVAPFDGMVDAGNAKLHVLQMGEGPYTVVFESGFGSDMSAWRKVAPALAKQAAVLVYSRAGTGQSTPHATGTGLEQSVADFESMLAAVKASGPFILVGHSYGSFLIRSYAARHPDQVAGLVFVDPADEGIEAVLARIDAKRVAADSNALQSMTPPQFRDELLVLQQIMRKGALPAMAALPDVPAVVLTSVRADPKAEFFIETPPAVRIKRERHQAFFAQFSAGAHVVTANSGHAIQLQEPELVIGAIEQVLDSAKRNARRLAQAQAQQTLMAELEKAAGLLGRGAAADAQALVGRAIAASGFMETQVNALGFDVLVKGKQSAMAGLILKHNAGAYPLSHNAADSFGEVLMAQGRALEARAQFERALVLGRQGGASERALAGYQSNLSKAETALR
ncbi:MAG TPA: alpha/beta fold hydrolase [Telluria sp.]|jgi:pimeloyl-ACP methyl ester carboxylesterase